MEKGDGRENGIRESVDGKMKSLISCFSIRSVGFSTCSSVSAAEHLFQPLISQTMQHRNYDDLSSAILTQNFFHTTHMHIYIYTHIHTIYIHTRRVERYG